MGLFENESQKARKVARREQWRQAAFAAQRQTQVEAAQRRQTAAQEAQLQLLGMLGAPGTYDLPGTPATTPTTAVTEGLFTTVEPTQAAREVAGRVVRGEKPGKRARYAKMFEGMAAGELVLDPETYAQTIAQTPAFRLQSRMQAEAEQLLAQQGPAWEMLSNSTLGQISESAAELTRESLRQVRNAAAKGGTARRQALAEAQTMLAAEAGHRLKAQETWKANLALFEYTRNYAQTVQTAGQNFLNNLPLINQAYQGAMDNLTSVMAQSITASAQASQHAAETLMEGYYQETGGFLEGLIIAGISLVAAQAGGPMMGQMVGQTLMQTTGAGGTPRTGQPVGIPGLTTGEGLIPGGEYGVAGDIGGLIRRGVEYVPGGRRPVGGREEAELIAGGWT